MSVVKMTRIELGVLVLVGLLGCSSKSSSEGAKQDKPASREAGANEQADRDAPPPDKGEANFADPQVQPPPAPEGAVTLKDPWLYVQTCAEPHACVDLEQPAADAHCRELRLGGLDSWRLPSKDEVPRFNGVAGLEQTQGYHWTRTPFEDDIGQVWIVDPSGEGPATTIPRERKPFRVRCVKEP